MIVSPAPLRVMLVDDHALVRSAVAQAITAPDLTVVAEAGTAEDALELGARERPDLILLDVNLPGMSGLELVRELRSRVPGAEIVMLSATHADRDVADAIAGRPPRADLGTTFGLCAVSCPP